MVLDARQSTILVAKMDEFQRKKITKTKQIKKKKLKNAIIH